MDFSKLRCQNSFKDFSEFLLNGFVKFFLLDLLKLLRGFVKEFQSTRSCAALRAADLGLLGQDAFGARTFGRFQVTLFSHTRGHN